QYDPYSYSGLYYALTKLDNRTYNAIRVPGPPRNRINSLILNESGSGFYAAGADGRIFAGDFLTLKSEPTNYRNAFPNKVLALSPDQRYLVNGTDSAFIQIFDLTAKNSPHREIRGFRGATNALEFLDNGTLLVASGDVKRQEYAISKVDVATGTVSILATFPAEVKTMSVAPSGDRVACGTWDGKVLFL